MQAHLKRTFCCLFFFGTSLATPPSFLSDARTIFTANAQNRAVLTSRMLVLALDSYLLLRSGGAQQRDMALVVGTYCLHILGPRMLDGGIQDVWERMQGNTQVTPAEMRQGAAGSLSVQGLCMVQDVVSAGKLALLAIAMLGMRGDKGYWQHWLQRGLYSHRFNAVPHSTNAPCPICLGVLTNPVSPCPGGHLFCRGCINEWAVNKLNCPICRCGLVGESSLRNPVDAIKILGQDKDAATSLLLASIILVGAGYVIQDTVRAAIDLVHGLLAYSEVVREERKLKKPRWLPGLFYKLSST